MAVKIDVVLLSGHKVGLEVRPPVDARWGT